MKSRQKYSEDELLGSVKISTAVSRMALPAVISSLVTVIYNMADTFFVGQTGDPLEVAAVSLTNPCFVLMMAVANMLGMGGAAVLSVALGAREDKTAKQATSFSFWSSIGFGVIFTVIFLVCMHPLLLLLGADKETYDLAAGYLRWIAPGAAFCIWSVTASFVVRAAGFSTPAMVGNLIGTFLNIALDPLFISGLHQGAAGAAIATTISNIAASVYYIWFFLKRMKGLSIHPKDFTLKKEISLTVIRTGLPTGLFSGLMGVATILINQILTAWGNNAVAAMGIVFKVNMLVSFIQMGIANGVQPLLGYAYGAHNRPRFQGVEKYTRRILILIGIILTAVFLIFRQPIMSLFIQNKEVIRLGVPMLTAYVISGPLIGIFFLNMDCLQSTGAPEPATLLSALKNGILLIPLLFLMKAVFGFYGIISAQAVTDYAVILLAVVFWKKRKRQLESGGSAKPRRSAGVVSQ